jgi:hypothetical protein
MKCFTEVLGNAIFLTGPREMLSGWLWGNHCRAQVSPELLKWAPFIVFGSPKQAQATPTPT